MKAKTDTVSAEPLFGWFKGDKARRAVLRAAGYSDGRITNWKARGIPRAEVGAIAGFMGVSYEDYLALTGEVVKGSHGLRLGLEEAEAIKRLRKAHPDWRRYVLGLAMVDQPNTQEILLTTMRQAVPDYKVEKAFGSAPHVAARKRAKEPR